MLRIMIKFTLWRLRLTQFNNSVFMKGLGLLMATQANSVVSMLCPLCVVEVTKTHRDMKSLLLFLNSGCFLFLTLVYY